MARDIKPNSTTSQGEILAMAFVANGMAATISGLVISVRRPTSNRSYETIQEEVGSMLKEAKVRPEEEAAWAARAVQAHLSRDH